MAAAIVGRRVHVIGGIEMPNATTASPRHFSLDLDEVATAAGVGDALYLFGGCSLAADADGRAVRSYACDAWWYAGGAWTRLPDMPRGRRQRPRPRPFTTRASSSSRATTEHSLPVGASHKGFTRDILRFDSTNRTWHAAGALTTAPPMTVPTAPWRDGFIFFSGEVRPGVSTPQVFVYVPSR
jgi:N-acetylneuraminic acid mutarotase